MSGKLFVIAGPSGSGKTTIVESLLSSWHHPVSLKRAITYTTRPPRPQEKEGRDYFFIKEDEFKAKEADGFFLETTFFCNHWYGSARSLISEIEKEGAFRILIMDQAGVLFLKGKSSVVVIGIMPPTEQELIHRLEKRDGSNERIEKALQEVTEEQLKNSFDYYLINADLRSAVSQLKNLILSLISNKNEGV